MRIAITGGIAEGKSTVLGYLRELGYSTASADDVAREVFDQPDVQAALQARLHVEGPVGREWLRQRVSESPEVRRGVNRIMHRSILEALFRHPATFFEIPLLLETCLQGRFDRVWVVTCGPEEQTRRLVERVGNSEEARKMLATQLPSGAKWVFADEIVRTNTTELSVREYVLAAVASEFGK
ncbi:MAG: dephospho-CoA kinase [Fimbriimonadaceae bacterium]|nr:dephospho-CoA kinase [Fimbriimonadaceae bacterium]